MSELMTLEAKIKAHALEAESSWGQSYPLFCKVIKKRELKRGAEIGVAFGGHAEAILNILTVDKLYGVDPYQHREDYKDLMNLPQEEFDVLYAFVLERMTRFGKRYEHIRKMSTTAVDSITEPLDFVYLDGDHSFKGIWNDLCAWYYKVRVGGVIGGHDYDIHKDVNFAVHEFFAKVGGEIHVEGAGVWWVEKQNEYQGDLPSSQSTMGIWRSRYAHLTQRLSSKIKHLWINNIHPQTLVFTKVLI